MTHRQRQIMAALRHNNEMTLDQITDLVGGDLYCNAKKHVGVSLSSMVRAGMIERARPGVFRLKKAELGPVFEVANG